MTVAAKPLTDRARRTRASGNASGVAESARNLHAYVDALRQLGYDADGLLRHAGLHAADLEDPDGWIPCGAVGAVFGAAFAQRPLRNAGLQIALKTSIGAFPLIDYLVLTSDTVGAGLQQLARCFRLVTSGVSLECRADETPIRAVYEGGPGGSLQHEFGIALCLRHLRSETNGAFRAEYASFAHCPDDVAEFERALDCPVRVRASWNGWAMSREVWNLPLRRRDPILRELLERQATAALDRQPSTSGVALDVRRTLISRLTTGDTSIEAIARALAVSVRSLQRRLAEEGQSYQALVDATRREAAERYLSDSALSIAEVGFLLGYSEAAAFHRAFKRWTGVTPQQFRRDYRR